jgi:hypothetical protein
MVYAHLDRFTLANLDALHDSFADLYHIKAIVDRPRVTGSTLVLVPKIGNCYPQAARTMDFYLLAVSGVSTLCLCGGEAKRIQGVRLGPNRRVFRGYRAHPTHTKSEEKGYENHPTTVYSTRTRDRS